MTVNIKYDPKIEDRLPFLIFLLHLAGLKLNLCNKLRVQLVKSGGFGTIQEIANDRIWRQAKQLVT